MTGIRARFCPSIDQYGHIHLFSARTPSRLASELSEAERRLCLEAYRGRAASYRRRRAIGSALAAALGLLWVLLSDAHPSHWGAVLALGALALVWLVLGRAPTCPSCCNRMTGRFGPFCPQCGGAGLSPGTWRIPRCALCSSDLGVSKRGRHYRIHACTMCGLMLDPAGI
jgi:hypothetical protein